MRNKSTKKYTILKGNFLLERDFLKYFQSKMEKEVKEGLRIAVLKSIEYIKLIAFKNTVERLLVAKLPFCLCLGHENCYVLSKDFNAEQNNEGTKWGEYFKGGQF